MADYAIGLSFHKANRTLVRAVRLNPPCRYFATRDSAGLVTLPTLDAGARYVEIQGLTQANFSINDNDQEFRLLGDDGWSDSVITGSRVQAGCTGYFLRNTEIPAGRDCPIFLGNYDEGFALIEESRYNKDFEIYVEFLKELGQADGETGDWIYDFTGFNAVIMNYAEPGNAEGLTEVTFDLMSRGAPVFGRYNAGSTRLSIGQVQTGLLFTNDAGESTGDRRYAVAAGAVDPLDNGSGVVVSDNITVTYTSDGSVALTELALGATDGSGFRLEVASTGELVPSTITLASNVVTINPDSDLAASTIYRLRASDGAIVQSVDANGAASPTGFKAALQGFTNTFQTA